MKYFILCCIFAIHSSTVHTQTYFPPNDSETWETIPLNELNWCSEKADSLVQFLDENNTRAFILLKDGKIVIEKYFGDHNIESNWYWASAGKSLTAFVVGIAAQENLININEKSSTYLGESWTSCTSTQEENISVRNQLTMTSGLDDDFPDSNCTSDSCLQYLTEPATRWAYHNGPYTLLHQVVENASGQTFNSFLNQRLKMKTGMNGLFLAQEYNKAFYSTARSMARFGLLMLNKGNWNGDQILGNSNYFNEMINSSQKLNEAYGYLWWLNGKNSYMTPKTQFVFDGSLNPSAPQDMYAALGKNGQCINVIPSENMVWIRMGEIPENSLVPFEFNEDVWKYINELSCTSSALSEQNKSENNFSIYPNPVDDYINLKFQTSNLFSTYAIYDNLGRQIKNGSIENRIQVEHLTPGVYYLELSNGEKTEIQKFIK